MSHFDNDTSRHDVTHITISPVVDGLEGPIRFRVFHNEAVGRRLTTPAGEDKDESMNSSLAWILVVAMGALLTLAPWVAGGEPPEPGATDRCAVCGMYVAKYPNWVAAVVFSDGTREFFDGPKDMFRYLLDLPKYAHTRDKSEITDVFVTDYYTTEIIDGTTARYIAGSDVVGPMGAELVPVSSPENATVFMKDHRGVEILTFDQISVEKIPK